ncbi:hypothetical protein VTN96DRAFT_10464 [Rasamsonia emersonii]|uniref:Homeobox and C2H2 transcription factor n=1 Tax=Rasamsonia emersonii (strain ATCC 16479 / CBS 393.64 / IMI 116815) TaxID=1408163 RepID=A0A0F4Z2B7_RASE3|nr:Homeobox and C2H2 transcription factor [Rasamsonia emersonii CBS 393.64]KKA24221.1 Homeobox and C2H2 transcription factor [Rasamsonia emersonii CBS 393.64]
MEYFDFDEASFASNAREDDVASDYLEVDEADATERYESLFHDKTFELHRDAAPADSNDFADPEPPTQTGDDSAVPEPDAGGDYPMFRAKEPCDFCERMGLDCFIIQRGVLNNGCTCCISLYRECSFTHAREPGKYLATLHPVSEDVDIPTGGPNGKRALKSLGDDLDGRSRKSGARFPREAVRILKNWLSEHYQHPYPTEQEKDELKEKTGLKRSQISNWLANARRRGKVRPSPRSSSPPVAGGLDVPGRSSSSSGGLDLSSMTPLERWKHSPPEHEAASTSAIIRAMANPPFQPPEKQQNQQQRPSQFGHGRSLSRKTGSSNDSSYSSMFHAPSVSSLDTENRSSISDLSFASAFSHRSSLNSFGSMDRKERRRRRKPAAPTPILDRQKTRGARIFQCTFCTDSFPAKYDWQRHEKSLHLALEKWTCAPQGGIVTTSDKKKLCVFCRAPNPDFEHLESHNFSSCQEKTVQERTFYRKDHLNQHLRLMHNVKFDPWMENWRSTTTEIKSRCGFCNATFTTWKDRVDHLAAHFKNGADMAQWQGDWGFEPCVQRLVENAIPPYLIAQERASMDPYKASASNLPGSGGRSGNQSNRSSVHQPVSQNTNCYQRLERELKAYIRRQVEAGTIPTDTDIQYEARQIIYGTDDPWNQTSADNPIWLSNLKRDCGLEPIPGSDHNQLANPGMQQLYAAAGSLQQPPIETNPMPGSLRNSWPSNTGLESPGLSGPEFSGSIFSPAGFHTAAPSMPASLAGSFVGSAGVSSAGPVSGVSAGWSGSFSAGVLSSSAPNSAPVTVDPLTQIALTQMSFDPEFLEQLNDQYGEIPDTVEGLGGNFDTQGLTGDHPYATTTTARGGDVFSNTMLATSGPGSKPISIPGADVNDPGPQQQFVDPSYFGASSFHG